MSHVGNRRTSLEIQINIGFLRLHLALCVVLRHAGGKFQFILHDGIRAVEPFFIISGFCMALVLNGKYASTRQ